MLCEGALTVHEIRCFTLAAVFDVWEQLHDVLYHLSASLHSRPAIAHSVRLEQKQKWRIQLGERRVVLETCVGLSSRESHEISQLLSSNVVIDDDNAIKVLFLCHWKFKSFNRPINKDNDKWTIPGERNFRAISIAENSHKEEEYSPKRVHIKGRREENAIKPMWEF